jgi:hypothetical protein
MRRTEAVRWCDEKKKRPVRTAPASPHATSHSSTPPVPWPHRPLFVSSSRPIRRAAPSRLPISETLLTTSLSPTTPTTLVLAMSFKPNSVLIVHPFSSPQQVGPRSKRTLALTRRGIQITAEGERSIAREGGGG